MAEAIKTIRNSARTLSLTGWAIFASVMVVTLCYVAVGVEYFWA